MYFALTMKTPVTLLLLLVCTTAFAQSDSLLKELNDIYYGNKVYESITYDSGLYEPYRQTAKKALENYIAKYPENPYRFDAMCYLAQIFGKLNLVDSAVLLYKQVMSMPDHIDRYNRNRANASSHLTEIYLAKKEYNTAFYYLELTTGKYFFKSNCGTVIIEERRRINKLIWDCYFGLGYYKKAIDMFGRLMFNNFAHHEQNLYYAYVKLYSKEKVKKEFLKAEHTIKIKNEYIDSRCYFNPVVKIFDKELELRTGDEFEKLTEQERMQQCIEKYRNSTMYKLATQGL